jgi:hypothetical protein
LPHRQGGKKLYLLVVFNHYSYLDISLHIALGSMTEFFVKCRFNLILEVHSIIKCKFIKGKNPGIKGKVDFL